MTDSPKVPSVSVVMGVYNDRMHLERAVGSILAQSFGDLELIVVDDGSSDGSSELLDRLAGVDSRMRVLHQANSGLTRALVRGCELAQGKYIARQDSDDWSHPRRIEDQLRLIEADERIGFVSCATQYVGPGDEPLTILTRPSDPAVATHGLVYLRQGPPAHGSVMMKKALYVEVGGYRPEFYYSQDSDLWLRMAERSLIAYVPDVRYFHCKSEYSTSGARRGLQSAFAELSHRCRHARLRGVQETPLLDEARALAEAVQSGQAFDASDRSGVMAISYFLGSQLASNRDSRARTYLWRVLRARPLHIKAWLRLVQSIATGRAHN
jgi:glycosyltransferase involved in cell wall biosynthesis